jgi:hypothetical protein
MKLASLILVAEENADLTLVDPVPLPMIAIQMLVGGH